MPLCILCVQLAQICCNLGVDLQKRPFEFLGSEIARTIVHRRELASIDRHKLTTEQIKLLAEQSKGATDVAKWLQIVLAKVSNRLEVRRKFFEQPHQLN